jgi:hypothetical protein
MLVQAGYMHKASGATPHLDAASLECIIELLVGILYTKLGISLPLSAA